MKWEYKIIEVGKTKTHAFGLMSSSKELDDSELNKLGEEGWELVSTLSVSGSAVGFGTKAKPDQTFFIFKRQKI